MGRQLKVKDEISKPTCQSVGYSTALKIVQSISGAMTSREICNASGISQSTVSRAITHLRYAGDLTTDGRMHTLTGTNKLLTELELIKPRSNTGLTGVSFSKSNNRFQCSYGRHTFIAFDNLLDAACKRKSLENNI